MSERAPAPAPRPARLSALLLWVIAAVGLFATNLLSIPLGRAMAGMDVQALMLILNLIYYIPFTVLPVLLLARRNPGMYVAYRPYPISILGMLGIVALALLGLFFTTDLTALVSIPLEALGLNVNSASLAMPSTARGLTVCILYVAVIPAICEEFLFRGAILSAQERYGTRRALLTSAAMFALLHGSLAGLPAHFLLGLIMGWLVICCDSIYAGLIYHTAHNAASVILQFIVSRSDLGGAAAPATMFEAVGGLMGVLELLFEVAIMGAMILFTLKIYHSTARLRGVQFAPDRREKLRRRELLLLILGLVFTGLLYGADIYSMLP